MGLLILFLFNSFSSLNSSPIIKIEGNRHFSDSEIIHTLDIPESQQSLASRLPDYAQKIISLYKSEGYLKVEVACEISDNTVFVHISEGILYRMGKITFSGNKFIKDDRLDKFFIFDRNQTFHKIYFDRSVEEILIFYGNRGFPFAKIVPSSFYLENDKLNIDLEIEEGPRLKWGETTISGNAITKTYVIGKQMRIPIGRYFSEEQFDLSRAWLDKLSFIELTDEFALIRGQQSGTVSILARFKEKKSNRIGGIVGYIPQEENTKGGFIGSFSALFLNLFGTARFLSVRWEKHIPPYTELELSYTEPWILNSYFSATSSLSHLIQDTLYSFSKANLEAKTDISLNLSLGIITGWEHFVPATTNMKESRKYTVASNVVFSNVDYVANALRGIDYSFYTEYGRKSSENIMKFTVELLNIIPIFSNNTISVLFSGKSMRTNNPPLPEYEQFALGGYKSLRGYREKQFRTTQMLRLSPEFSYLLSKMSRLYLFYDCAYFETSNYETAETKKYFKDAYGMGAKLSSRIGIISIEYALGEERTFMKGKIHIGLDSVF